MKLDKSNITGLTKEKKEILRSACGSCNCKISLSDVVHEMRLESRQESR
jgi:hypothetical protein